MANWYNARLLVVGRSDNVLEFSRMSSAQPSSLFTPDMLQGEAQDMISEQMEQVEPGLAQKVYIFQVRYGDGLEHFCRISLQFPVLNFVLVYEDASVNSYGSYYISRGQVQTHELPDELKESVMAKHGVTADSSDDECEIDDTGYWEATWELMDLAEAYWQDAVLSASRR